MAHIDSAVMRVTLAYGQHGLDVELPSDRTTVIAPTHVPGLPDERAAVLAALDSPIAARPLRDWLDPGARVCISFSDLTRATPNHRLIPWLLEYLAQIPRLDITLLNQTGTHRANTTAELEQMLTPEVARRCRILNHQAEDLAAHVTFGEMRDGTPAWINREVAQAHVRIVTGFIEPHFFAGFSGGVKGIIPGTGGLPSIMSNHGPRNIGYPNATFGITVGNPLWEELRDVALRVGPSFVLNVTLNEARQITGVFAGDLVQAHQAGCAFVKQSAMRRVPGRFDVVVTTNSGYPLDLNLYQGVKGMAAGARILKPGGLLILACECREGAPPGSPYERLLRSADNSDALLKALLASREVQPEQWQAQIQANLQRHAEVRLYSSLPDETVHGCHLTPCHDITAAVQERLRQLGPDARVAALPHGPLTVPYLE